MITVGFFDGISKNDLPYELPYDQLVASLLLEVEWFFQTVA